MSSNTVTLVTIPETCYRCGRLTVGIVGARTPVPGGGYALREFDFIAHALAEVLDWRDLRAECIGPIKLRRSRVRGSYLSNGCVHCDAILGSFPLLEAYQEYLCEGGTVEELLVSVPVREVVT